MKRCMEFGLVLANTRLFRTQTGIAAASEAEVAAWVQALMVDVGELKPRSEASTRSVEAPTAPHRG